MVLHEAARLAEVLPAYDGAHAFPTDEDDSHNSSALACGSACVYAFEDMAGLLVRVCRVCRIPDVS